MELKVLRMSQAARNTDFDVLPPEQTSGRAKIRKKPDPLLTKGRNASPLPPARAGHWKSLVGLTLAGVAAPFMAVSLVQPAWTGPLGQWLSGSSYQHFGVTSTLAPMLVFGWGLRLLLPQRYRPIQLTWGPLLLSVNLDLIAQRMGAQGGSFGELLDQGLVQNIGPAGAWLVALLSLPVSSLLVCRTHPLKATHALVDLIHWGLDSCHETWSRWTRHDEGSVWTTPLKASPPIPREPRLLPFEEPVSSAKPFLLRPAPRLDVEGQGLGQTPRLLGRSRPYDSDEPSAPSLSDQPAARSQKAESQPTNRSSTRPQRGESPSLPTQEETAQIPLLAPLAPLTAVDEVIDPRLWASAPRVTEAPPRRPADSVSDEIIPSSESDVSVESTAMEALTQVEASFEDEIEPSVEESAEAEGPIEDELEVVEESSLELPGRSFESEAELPPAPVRNSASIPPPRLAAEPKVVAGEQLKLFPSMMETAPARYHIPPLALLNDVSPNLARRPIEDKSQILLDALESFGVQAHLLGITRGPAVTRYELQPARGVKVARFTSLTNDIALALAAKAVRIEAPIPGKAAIGIEIPNDQTDLVVLKDILGSSRFRKSVGMSFALGKDLQGAPTFANLQKMPHLLVAGTTGSGKSGCVNGLILSLLYRFTPNQLQLLMIDPKQVELSIYEGIPHLIGFAKGTGNDNPQNSIICDPKRAALALHQVVELMEHRYGQFAAARVRNLEEFNEVAEEPLPWVVVIIDELADLMMVASKSVETSICRIAQKARAAGIHLVLATQRPSADVITGLIKVNIPSRIAFAVSSQVDSRVILDTGGAENLLGKGDMLFCPVDASDPRRIQGCFVTNEEILRVVEFWKAQGTPDNLIALQISDMPEDADGEDDEGSEDDALVEQALEVITRRQQASASLLQTELKVGYARARRLIYLMEKKGYIGPAEGSKPRKILFKGG